MTTQRLQQHQKQQQRLSPQQIQYIKLLQLPTAALEQRIKEELEINPILEDPELDDVFNDEVADALPAENNEVPQAEQDPAERNIADDFTNDDLFHEDEYYGYKTFQDKDDSFADMPTPHRESMLEHLQEQIGLLDLDDIELFLAERIIGSIDNDGYLRRPIQAIADETYTFTNVHVGLETAMAVLRKIQRMDPVGIAARDLQECLLIQLEVLPTATTGRRVAMEMLRNHYKSFSMKHFNQIMRRLGVDELALKEAFDLVKRLNPKPGEDHAVPQENYITPDFMVEMENGTLVIGLNAKNSPQLRISRHYKEMWNHVSGKNGKIIACNGLHSSKNAETKLFLKNKIESARWFINSINQRRQTMLKVMDAIVCLQENFFRYGEGHLKPMILKDVAEMILMDISTVSRVVNSKYVQTEFGIYSLKYFFSEGLSTEDGDEVSNKEIKMLIYNIIESERKGKPLSDQRIAKMLELKGFNIARRTVTKYREQLNIPVARMRKQIVLS